ncbi:isoaspartyl peptidase/L-asparaginase family protein [Parapedobacter sp. SGR-10]|uniref:isoaspartyl peptidase/L-asparaginase family protein n=1 Tax=Parapedobacter sp. SGR-10 TaxID=2710879 RepID=UPI001981E6FA|nr:isoaspartyl peptidase/L-asparaginase [Parapedobacter sp. SGR-10]
MMRLFICTICTFFGVLTAAQAQEKFSGENYVLVIHGGAGSMSPNRIKGEVEAAYVAKLTEALKAGYAKIKNGESSVEAVIAAIEVMEDSPLFNAGKGAVFTHNGKNELDASIMDGKTRMAGAVAGITTVKNPIKAARAVMEKSGHVMLTGKGAEIFAESAGLEIVSPEYFWTQHRWDALQKILKRDSTKVELDHDEKQTFVPTVKNLDEKYGTVGAVARDKNGNLAAGTSTGGMMNKKYGRVGDSPIIGAGNYANDQVAISCTGWGEFFIRTAAAYNVSAQMKHLNRSVQEAAQKAIDEIGELGGTGGIIALDKDGKVAVPYNTKGMYRGAVKANGEIEVAIF